MLARGVGAPAHPRLTMGVPNSWSTQFGFQGGTSLIAVISAPTNLGLRPPEEGATPGTAKAPEALREAGLFTTLQAAEIPTNDAGTVLARRYLDDDETRAPGSVRNQEQIIEHARRLAHRIVRAQSTGESPLVIGGDCSVILAAGLASRVLKQGGLVHVDGHTDFRHPGNSSAYGSLAGEDLALAIGRHFDELANVDGLGPYFAKENVAHLGHRDDDEHIEEARANLALIIPASDVVLFGARSAAKRIRETEGLGSGYWLHIDTDVLDPEFVSAVDSPTPGGLHVDDLIDLLTDLAPHAWGASVSCFDPDLDPDGTQAELLVGVITRGLGTLGSALHEE